MEPDVRVENHGSVILICPLTDDARLWVDENVQIESWQWWGDGFAVEPRYASDLIIGMRDSRLEVL